MGFVSSEKLAEYTGKLVTKLRTIFATQSMIGAPKKAATVADMTNTDTIYVYTGSEIGYTAGNWYYYDQGSWLSGGIYNATAFATDTTLTQPGQAADAAAAGSAINNAFSATAKRQLLYLLRHVSRWTITDAEDRIDELEAELFPGGEAVAITAAFVQAGNTIYDNDDLDSLRQYLTVTAEDAGGTTTIITDYVLTGTLSVGTSTITVVYGNLSTTFTVAVTLNDVRFCEYIETADSTNWIKTDLVPSDALGYKLKVLPLVQQSGSVMGSRNSSQVRYLVYVENNAIYVGWNSSQATGKSYTTGVPFTIEVNHKNSRKVKVDGVETSLSLSTLPNFGTYYIALLGRNFGGDYTGTAQRFYPSEFTDGQTVVKKYVPAYKSSNGEIGVYEKLSHTFLGNTNTGGTATGFTKGADI